MSDNAITTTVPPAGPTGVTAAPAPAKAPKAPKHPVYAVLEVVASLRVTVVLFALSLVLVFYGTVAQIDNGIWTVVNDYFRSVYVFIPLRLTMQFLQRFFWVPASWSLPGALPFPGGLTLGALLLLNLLAAHAIRFKLAWNRVGVVVLHAGLVLMVLGEFMAKLSLEGNMTIAEGQTTNVVTHNRYSELAVVDRSAAKTETVTVVPGAMLSRGKAISSEELPFDVKVIKWLVNCRLKDIEGNEDNLATAGAGLVHKLVELDEVSGVDTKQTADIPGCYAELFAKDGTSMGVFAFSLLLKEQAIKAGDKTYDVSLRIKETYKDYSLTLKEFRFDRYTGTGKAKNYQSVVRLVDPETGEDREVTIRMNEPLRHRGETFFQASFDEETEKTTVLQVVRNPAWQLPYWSCAIVTLGMCIHFGLTLANFLARRAAA